MSKRSIYTESEIRNWSDTQLIDHFMLLAIAGTISRELVEKEMRRRNLL